MSETDGQLLLPTPLSTLPIHLLSPPTLIKTKIRRASLETTKTGRDVVNRKAVGLSALRSFAMMLPERLAEC
jgi:hypothetical protein